MSAGVSVVLTVVCPRSVKLVLTVDSAASVLVLVFVFNGAVIVSKSICKFRFISP